MKIHTFADQHRMAAAVTAAIVEHIRHSVATRGCCHLSLAGGSSPGLCYALLRHADLPWQALHLWFGDERCLPVGDGERNDVMADALWLRHVPIPPAHIHRIPAELGAEAAALAYSEALQGIERLDLALLGMGEDGHTASLFPAHPSLEQKGVVIAVHQAPKPPPDRVSLSLETLNAARQRFVIVAGEGKRAVWQRILDGKEPSLPVCQLHEPVWFSALGASN